MIAVSNAWKAAQTKTLLPEMFVEITYETTEPSLYDDVVVSGSSAESYSDLEQLVAIDEKTYEAYTTLDYGAWGLDGRFSYFDETSVYPGYVDTTHVDSDAVVGVIPTITIDFGYMRDAILPGLTITWGEPFGGWAEDFRITASNSGGVVAQADVVGNNNLTSVTWLDAVNYSQITIEIFKWSHPYQRPRCVDVRLGIKTVYTKDDLLGYEHSQSVDLLSATLPANKIQFQLRNDDGRWNPDNPKGSEKYLIEQQEIKVRYGMDIDGTVEWVEGGTFWLSEWSTPANGLEASFTASCALCFMDVTYTGPRSGTLYDIALAAFVEADIPAKYEIDEVLTEYTTDFSGDDSDYTTAEIVQMVAHAAGCVIYQDRFGIVHLKPWSKSYSGYVIGQNISYVHPEYTISKPLKAVSVAYGDKLRTVIPVGTKGEVQTIDNPLIVTKTDAERVASVALDVLENRKVISGEFRADLRVEALDSVIVTSKYASNIIGVTEIKYSTTGGAFKGTYTGRVVSIDLVTDNIYSGEFYLGEI